MSLPDRYEGFDLTANAAAEEALRRLVDALLDLVDEIQELRYPHEDVDGV